MLLAATLISPALAGGGTPVHADTLPAAVLASPAAISAVSVIIDGNRQNFRQPAVLRNNRVLVPLRGIFEGLGATVQWDESTRTVSATKDSTTVVLTIGRSSATVNGQAVGLDTPAQIINGATMVPLRFVSETLGANVQWNARTSTVTVNSGGGSTIQPPQEEEHAFVAQVVSLVNQARSEAKLPALTADSELARVALVKAKDMEQNNYFDHKSPTHGSPFEMMQAFGITYSYAGENIAKGQRTPEEVVNAWLNSPGHRANILSRNFTRIGVGFYEGHWVQLFTG